MSASILLAKAATVILACAYLGACLLLYISGAGHADGLFGVAMSEEMASFLAKYSR